MNTLRLTRSFGATIVVGLVVLAITALPASSRTLRAQNSQATRESFPTLTNVTIEEDYYDSDAHAGIYAALDQGYWKKLGLNVTVEPGGGSVTTVQQVAAGDVTFGYANAFSMVQEITKGASVVAVAATRQLFDGGVVYWPDTGISKPSDLVGKTYIGDAGGFVDELLPLFAQNSGNWDLAKMQYHSLDPTAGAALFAAHQADAITGTETQLALTPPYHGVNAKVFRYADYGIDPLGFAVITTQKELEGNPGVVKAFVQGYLKGWAWACANPTAAVVAARHYYTTTLSVPAGVALWDEVCSYAHTPASKGHPLGWMAPKDWQDTVNILTSHPKLFGSAASLPPLSQLFTNRFIPS
jgi:NitT/TauT family transport system substrate-binding protein